MGSRVDKMFDGKNKNGGLVDDIILARQNQGEIKIQTGFNTNDDLDSTFMGARLKVLEYFKFAMVTGNLKQEAKAMTTFNECLNVCSKYIQ